MKMLSRLNITFKNTFPIYIMISLVTLIFLMAGNYINSFSSFGKDIPAKMLFSSIYNLLYLIPQSLAVFIALSFLKKKSSRWFFRITPSSSIIFTFIMILFFRTIDFFPKTVDIKDLYVHLLIILIMNVMFSVIIALNIYSKARHMLFTPGED